MEEERGQQQTLGLEPLQDGAREKAAENVGAVHAAERDLAQVIGRMDAGLEVSGRDDSEHRQETGRALRNEVSPDAVSLVFRRLFVGRVDFLLVPEALVA